MTEKAINLYDLEAALERAAEELDDLARFIRTQKYGPEKTKERLLSGYLGMKVRVIKKLLKEESWQCPVCEVIISKKSKKKHQRKHQQDNIKVELSKDQFMPPKNQ